MDRPEDLPLRDIHLPADPSWWPPAPGWWILLTLLAFVTVGIGYLYWHRQQMKLSSVSLARESLLALRLQYAGEHNAQVLVRELSVLLRRLSISTFPRVDTASLTGEAWLQFLDNTMSGQQFVQGAGRILIDAPYRAEFKAGELDSLLDLCDAWIVSVTEQKAGAPR